MSFEVLGLLGPAGSGKDLVADWLGKKAGFCKIAFADPIKRFARKAFNIDGERLWGESHKRNEIFEVDDAWWFEAIGHFPEASEEFLNGGVLEEGFRTQGFLTLHDWLTTLRREYREKISARVILQTLGTEWGRAVDDLMWAKYAHKVIKKLSKGGWVYTQSNGLTSVNSAEAPPGVVIPDHRFVNEIKLTQEEGGYVLRLRRLAHEKKEESVGIAGHRSEAEQKTIPDAAFDHVLNFEEGIEKVDATLQGAFEHKLWINTRGRS